MTRRLSGFKKRQGPADPSRVGERRNGGIPRASAVGFEVDFDLASEVVLVLDLKLWLFPVA